MAKKAKFEKLQVSALRRGEIQYETAYNARDAARIAAKRARKSEKPDPHAPHPRRKVWAKCTMTMAFKKRVRLR